MPSGAPVENTSYLQTGPGASAPLGFSSTAEPRPFSGKGGDSSPGPKRSCHEHPSPAPHRPPPPLPGLPAGLGAWLPSLRPAPPRRGCRVSPLPRVPTGQAGPPIVPLSPARPRAPRRAGSACTGAGGEAGEQDRPGGSSGQRYPWF